MDKENQFIDEFIKVQNLLYAENEESDNEVIKLSDEVLQDNKGSITRRRLFLNALKSVSNIDKFKPIIQKLIDSIENQIGQKIY